VTPPATLRVHLAGLLPFSGWAASLPHPLSNAGCGVTCVVVCCHCCRSFSSYAVLRQCGGAPTPARCRCVSAPYATPALLCLPAGAVAWLLATALSATSFCPASYSVCMDISWQRGRLARAAGRLHFVTSASLRRGDGRCWKAVSGLAWAFGLDRTGDRESIRRNERTVEELSALFWCWAWRRQALTLRAATILLRAAHCGNGNTGGQLSAALSRRTFTLRTAHCLCGISSRALPMQHFSSVPSLRSNTFLRLHFTMGSCTMPLLCLYTSSFHTFYIFCSCLRVLLAPQHWRHLARTRQRLIACAQKHGRLTVGRRSAFCIFLPSSCLLCLCMPYLLYVPSLLSADLLSLRPRYNRRTAHNLVLSLMAH